MAPSTDGGVPRCRGSVEPSALGGPGEGVHGRGRTLGVGVGVRNTVATILVPGLLSAVPSRISIFRLLSQWPAAGLLKTTEA